MHRVLTNSRFQSRPAEEKGAVAVIMAILATALLVASAMVLDFGLVRVDRQVNKSAADAAATAGLYGLNVGDTKTRPFRGVCEAVRFLEVNDSRFQDQTVPSIPLESRGQWQNAAATPITKANGCTDPDVRDEPCTSDPATWARFTWSGSWQGAPLRVMIQSGYRLDAGAGSEWSEESLEAVSADNNDNADGCHQLAVSITETRKPGLGSLATSADLVSSIRSVGRLRLGHGEDAPALLLLKRSGCPVLGTGGSGGGSFIRVYGASSADGRTQAGSIHSDASGGSCTGGSGRNIFWGRAGAGIAAYAAPLSDDASAPDPAKPGLISSYAVFDGFDNTGSVVSDGLTNVYGASGLSASAPGVTIPPIGRDLVTRSVVDDRYLGSTTPELGIRGIVNAAQSNIFSKSVASTLPWTSMGYVATHACSTPQGVIGSLPALNATKSLFVNCPGTLRAIPTLTGWENIVFSGSLDPTATISAPAAKKIYIFGSTSGTAINVQNSASTLSFNTLGRTDVNENCVTTPLLGEQALLVIKHGGIAQNGGTLRLCNTTLVMMGSRDDGCLPSAPGTAPTQTPCPGIESGVGNGQIDKRGGLINWTAPNQYSVMTLLNGDPDPSKSSAWTSLGGPEDLAFWSESANTTSRQFRMTGGGGSLRVNGVFMIPNADSFEIGGNSAQTLTNAQYVTTSIQLNGNGTNLTMSVDPNAAITLPGLNVVGLVR